jgi:ketosteroid isomerase-like protein
MGSSTEAVHEMYGAFARGDVPRVQELLDPDVVWRTPTLPWSTGEYRGREGVGTYFASFAEALDDAAVEPHEVLEAGDRIVALGEERATVRRTGNRFAVPFAHVLRLRDGRVVEFQGHVDTAAITEAFEPLTTPP